MLNLSSAAAAMLAAHGLALRGGLNFSSDEQAPARSVLLVGNVSGAVWPHFDRWRQLQPTDLANPLDTWSRQILESVAGEVGGRAVMPGDRPYHPFQQWAMRAERLRPSPLGILMHPVFGLWHAYRGALLLEEELDLPHVEAQNHPCDTCPGKPCLMACPFSAHSELGFDYPGCVAHLRTQPTCLGACLDRNACPYAIEYRYPADLQRFLGSAFLAGAGTATLGAR